MAVTLTTNYQLLNETYMGSWGYGTLYLRQYGKYDSQDIANLKTTYTLQLRVYCDGSYCTSGNCYADISETSIINNQTLTFPTNAELILGSKTSTVVHNTDGTRGVEEGASFKCFALTGKFTTNAWFWMPPIDVTPSFTTNPSVTSKTEETITVNRGITNISSNYYWSLDNSTWTKFTTATTNITGLTPNTAYTIYVQARNINNETYKYTKQLSVTTYSYPTQTLVSKTETSITMRWNADSTIGLVAYRLNDGELKIVGNASATTGTYPITGLNPNTTYTIETYLVRTSYNVTTKTSSSSIKTYAVPTQSLNAKTETTIIMNWRIDSEADRLYYSTDNGSTWSSAITVSGTGGSYAITNLNPSTTYTIKTRLRRSATQTIYDTTSLSVKTYALPTQSFASKTETTITMNWAVDSEVYRLYYSTNNGDTWSDPVAISGTSGEYTIEGLTANTSYNVLLKFRRVATQSNTTVASATAVTTYDYPTPLNAPNFTIGNPITLNFYNPLNRHAILKLIGDDGRTILYTGIDDTKYTGGNGSGSVSAQYASIPNKQKGSYKVQLTYDNVTKEYGYGTYKIRGDEKPTFTTFEYEDTNATTTGLKNENDPTIIKGYSTMRLTVSVANKAVANNSATMVKYRFKIGNKTYEKAYSSVADVSTYDLVGDPPVEVDFFTNVSTPTLSVTAIDSRSLETTVNIKAPFINYTNPAYTKASISRENGVGTTVLFDIAGTYWKGNFGAVNNSIYTVWYRWKLKTDTTYSNWISILYSFTRDTENATFTSNANVFFPETSNGVEPRVFDLGKEYDIQVVVADQMRSPSWQIVTFSLDSGIPCTDKVKNSSGTYNIGINQLADDDVALAITGGFKVDDVKIIGGVASLTNTQNQEFATTATWVATNVEFDTIDSTTSAFTLSNNGVKIGKGVSKILVSGAFTTNGYVSAGALQIGIGKNGTVTGKYFRQTIQTSWAHITLTMPPQPIDVRENDVINLVCTCSTAQSSVKFSKNFVLMTVQAIG